MMAQPTPDLPCPAIGAPLPESRQRWQAFVLLATGLAFEADEAGRLVFVAPDGLLGWHTPSLLGRPASQVLAGGVDLSGIAAPVRGLRSTVVAADGSTRCFELSLEPMVDARGRPCGIRGTGTDITARESANVQATAAVRRGEVLGQILGEIRQEVLAPRMMESALTTLARALGASGAAVLDLRDASVPYAVGAPVPEGAHAVVGGGAAVGSTAAGHRVLACPASTRFGGCAAVLAWRGPAGRAWDGEDLQLAEAITGIVRIVLEHEGIQRELARQARTDSLTGLMNRRAFLEEAARRIDRLDREELPGTLLFVDLDRLKLLNDRLGHDAGDEALVLTAGLLRRTVRPTDLIARLGGDEFAIWLDGSDEMTAAERAEGLRSGCVQAMAHLAPGTEAGGDAVGMTLSIGIACRRAGGGEGLDSLLHRADQAMYAVKRAGRGHWRVSHAEPAL